LGKVLLEILNLWIIQAGRFLIHPYYENTKYIKNKVEEIEINTSTNS